MACLYGLFSIYWEWATSHYGNRFLMPIVAAAAVPLAALLQWMAGVAHRDDARG
jgi:hypothetical protein